MEDDHNTQPQQRKSNNNNNVTTQNFEDFASKSLLELSLASDPEWNHTRIPFMDGGENYIDVKLAFMAELDGVRYGIGVPYDHAAALTIERPDGTVVNLLPDGGDDDHDHEELLQIMAGQLQEHVGNDLTLKRTPRILTIQGPLEKYTSNWKQRLVPEPIDAKTLLDDSDEDLEFFHNFMKRELGQEEYQKTMQEDDFDSEIDDEILDIFGEAAKTVSQSSVKDLFPNDDGTDDLFIQEMEDFVNKDIAHDGVALKILSYSLPDGNKYSIVQPLQSYALVGRYTENGEDIRFDLLSPQEAELVIPRLEEVCREDLQEAGLTAEDIAN